MNQSSGKQSLLTKYLYAHILKLEVVVEKEEQMGEELGVTSIEQESPPPASPYMCPAEHHEEVEVEEQGGHSSHPTLSIVHITSCTTAPSL
ncbi:hypothetical protein E2C01_014074 [Portunus trituberculatus]|uniref:Uncharacterized protein n=1 Tax=Portunus trituberculatus TaxID=210409 RepID=A0A5B7DHV5_PORTR|nr:hypothetical protein [Portunus trituberculatus]